MESVFIEAVQPGGPQNWGKFMVARFDAEEWKRGSEVETEYPGPLLRKVGWAPTHILVLDLQTGEGGMFLPGGSTHYDLEKHRIWVCPMFEPFLHWLYQQDLKDLKSLPKKVELEAEFALYGYRRPGPTL